MSEHGAKHIARLEKRAAALEARFAASPLQTDFADERAELSSIQWAIAELRATVPRSRYDACNTDWLRERDRANEIANKATALIEQITTRAEAAKQSLASAEVDARRYRRIRENWIDCDELGLHGRLAVIDNVIDAATTPHEAKPL